MKISNHYKVLLVALTLYSTSAIAQDSGFQLQDNTAEDDSGLYLAFAVSRINAEASPEFDNASVDFEDSDNAYNFRIGYMFSNWVGVEAAYYDFGEFEETLQSTVKNLGTTNTNVDLDLKGYGLSLVLNMPLPYIDLYLKGGVVKLEGEATASAFGLSVSAQEDSTEPFAAVGAELDFGTVNLFAEYSRIVDNDDVEVNFASLGLKLEL